MQYFGVTIQFALMYWYNEMPNVLFRCDKKVFTLESSQGLRSSNLALYITEANEAFFVDIKLPPRPFLSSSVQILRYSVAAIHCYPNDGCMFHAMSCEFGGGRKKQTINRSEVKIIFTNSHAETHA